MDISKAREISKHWRIVRLMLSVSNRLPFQIPLAMFREDPHIPPLENPVVDVNFLFSGNHQLGEALSTPLPIVPSNGNITREFATAYELAFRYLFPLEDPPEDLLEKIPSFLVLQAFEDHLISETKDYLIDTNFRETEKHLKRNYNFSYKEVPYIIRMTIAATDLGLTPLDYKMMSLMRLEGIEHKAMQPTSQDYATALNAIRARIKLLNMEGDDEDAEKVIEYTRKKLPAPIDDDDEIS